MHGLAPARELWLPLVTFCHCISAVVSGMRSAKDPRLLADRGHWMVSYNKAFRPHTEILCVIVGNPSQANCNPGQILCVCALFVGCTLAADDRTPYEYILSNMSESP